LINLVCGGEGKPVANCCWRNNQTADVDDELSKLIAQPVYNASHSPQGLSFFNSFLQRPTRTAAHLSITPLTSTVRDFSFSTLKTYNNQKKGTSI